MAALQNELPGFRGEKKLAFLLNHGDALAAAAWFELVGDEAVKEDAAGKRLERTGNNLQQCGFAAGVRAEHGDDFAGFGLEAGGFQREYRRLLGVGRVGVADLLDAEAWFARNTRRLASATGCRFHADGHANLRRNR